MSETLYELAYISTAVNPMSEPELDKMLASSRANNHQLTLSGMLLYTDQTFLQVLEGAREKVEKLYQHICNDPRHANIIIIHEGYIDQRNFADWKMGFRYLRPSDFKRKIGFTDLLREGSPAGDAFRLHPSTSHKLLHSFSQCSGVVPSVD